MTMKKPLLTLVIGLTALFITTPVFAITPTYVYHGWIERGGCQVQTVNWLSTNKVQCSYPLALVNVYTDSAGTISDTIYSDSIGTALAQPFQANSDGSFLFYSNSIIDYVKASGGGLPAAYQQTFFGTTAPNVTYLTQAAADLLYLKLVGGTLAGPGDLQVHNMTATGVGSVTGLLTLGGGLTITSGTTTLLGTNTGALTATTGVFSSTLQASGLATLSGGVISNNQPGNFGSGTVTGGNGSFSGNTTGTNDFNIQKSDSSHLTILAVRNLSNSGTTGSKLVLDSSVVANPPVYVEWTGVAGSVQDWLAGMNGNGTDWQLQNLTTSGLPLRVSSANNNTYTCATCNFGVGQSPSARIHAGQGGVGTTAEEIRIDSGSGAGGDALLTFYRNSANRAKVGISGSANDIITGSAANDYNVMNLQKTNWSANGSAAIQMSLNTSGFLSIGSATAVFPIHIVSATTPQLVVQTDATHRTGLWNDGTNGYVGTTTNNPLKLRTNNTDAVTVDTSQNVNFAAAVGLADTTGTYPLSARKAGTAVTGTTEAAVVSITDSTGVKGLLLGYDTGNAHGAISALNVANGSIDFWVHNGGATHTKAFTIDVNGLQSTLPFSTYNNQVTAGQGLPIIVGAVVANVQAAAIGTTTIIAAAQQSHYRVCWSQVIERAASTSSSVQTTIGWTTFQLGGAGTAKTSTYWVDPSAGTTGTTADASNTLGSERGNCFIAYTNAANITYATTYSTSGATTMQYDLKITVERLQ